MKTRLAARRSSPLRHIRLIFPILLIFDLQIADTVSGFVLLKPPPQPHSSYLRPSTSSNVPPRQPCVAQAIRSINLRGIAIFSLGLNSYIVPGPDNSQDLREFDIPQTVTEPLPLPQAVYVFGGYTSKSKARKLIRKGQVLVNDEPGKTCEAIVEKGDRIKVVAQETNGKQKGGAGRGVKKVVVVWEDDDLAVIVKPAGVAVHGTGAYSLVDEYSKLLQPTSRSLEDGALPKPVHAHRLDAPVGGLLLVAKTKPALQALVTAFLERRVQKTYRAVVIGRPAEPAGQVLAPVEGKDAVTRYKVVASVPSPAFGALTSIELNPETGRKHQLRQHCQALGTPILGDLRYGPSNTLRTRGLFLYSMAVSFVHPVTTTAETFRIEVPEIFGNTMNMERKKAERMAEEEEGGSTEEGEGA